MVRWISARAHSAARVALVGAAVFVSASAHADDQFRDASSLAPSVTTGDADFSARVMTRALRPLFVRPAEDNSAAANVERVAVRDGWRPRLSALSPRASAKFDAEAARDATQANQSDSQTLGAISKDALAPVKSPLASGEPELAPIPDTAVSNQSVPNEAVPDLAAGPTLAEESAGPANAEPEPAETSELAATPELVAGPELAPDLAGEPELTATPELAPDADSPENEQLADLSGDALDDALGANDAGEPEATAPPTAEADATATDQPAKPLARSAATANVGPQANVNADGIVATPRENLPPLNKSQAALRDKVRRVLKYYYDHPLHTGNRGPWEVMHQMLAFEVHSRIRQGGPNGNPITAVGWLCYNMPCRERELLYLNNDGKLRVRVGPALQGHQGQLLALLAQARVKSTYPVRVEGREFTIADLVQSEMETCYPKTELTFKLLGFQAYLDIDAKWVNDQGMNWDFATLVREEMRQPVRTAACGGTHRLSGLTFAYKKYAKSGRELTGEFAAAKRFVANYQNYAYRLQNSDGSFSTEWFRGPGSEADIDRRLKTTGHQLEWLLYVADEKQFTYPRTVKAVNYLANIMWTNRGRDWEAGPLGHAIHALVLYDRLYLQQYDEEAVATAPTNGSRR